MMKKTRKSGWINEWPTRGQVTIEEWKQLKREVYERDHFRCFRCDRRFPHGHGMSPHHIIPRKDGGSDDPENLISLCHHCHDYVEIYELRSKAEIIGSYTEPHYEYPVIPLAVVEAAHAVGKDAFERPEWHKWVYGGIKRVYTEG